MSQGDGADSRVPMVTIVVARGRIVAPATLSIGRVEGKPKRAGALLPGDLIYVPRLARGGWVSEYEFSPRPVLKVIWPQAKGDADFLAASGETICQECGERYFDHPFDRRFPDAWNPQGRTHYGLTLLCDGSLVKL